jgi:hypothetical protein
MRPSSETSAAACFIDRNLAPCRKLGPQLRNVGLDPTQRLENPVAVVASVNLHKVRGDRRRNHGQNPTPTSITPIEIRPDVVVISRSP